MLILGKTYFWTLLETCDPDLLNEFGEALRVAVSEVTGDEYVMVQPSSTDQETIRRWSKGCFNEPWERDLEFPRIAYVYHRISGDTKEGWTADVFFTRIPHIRGLYSNRATKHLLSASAQQELSRRLLYTHLANIFFPTDGEVCLGSAAALYAYYKVLRIPAVGRRSEASKYVPPASDLREFLRSLSAILTEGKPPLRPVSLSNGSVQIRQFLDECDKKLINSIGQEGIQQLLCSADISPEEWERANRRGILERVGLF